MISLIIILFSFVFSYLLSPSMPSQMASHWDINGQVNGYMPTNFGLYFLPLLTLVIFFLFKVLPKIDPYKKNFSQFEKYYQQFTIIVISFLVYIHSLTLVWNYGYHFNMIQLLAPALGILFYYAGILSQSTKQNWFVGIRTPWTMTNKKVWQETHKLGSLLFKITGLLSLFIIIWPNLTFYFLLVPILSTVIIVFIYSYWLSLHV